MEVYESSLAKAYFTSKAVDEPFYCVEERRKEEVNELTMPENSQSARNNVMFIP